MHLRTANLILSGSILVVAIILVLLACLFQDLYSRDLSDFKDLRAVGELRSTLDAVSEARLHYIASGKASDLQSYAEGASELNKFFGKTASASSVVRLHEVVDLSTSSSLVKSETTATGIRDVREELHEREMDLSDHATPVNIADRILAGALGVLFFCVLLVTFGLFIVHRT